MQLRKLNIINLGVEPYKKLWDAQLKLQNLRINDKISDTLILLEHNHVFTLGKVTKKEHLLISSDELVRKKIDLFEIDRGGDITYHGPGQIVGYPIIKLSDLYQDLHRYLRNLEEVIILTLKEFNLSSYRIPGLTGVWVNDEKIAAIGIKVTRWVTMHGFAFNVNTDLTYFQKIIPCGIKEKGVTSLQKIVGKKIDLNSVKMIIKEKFMEVFRYDLSNEYSSIDEMLINSSSRILEGI